MGLTGEVAVCFCSSYANYDGNWFIQLYTTDGFESFDTWLMYIEIRIYS